MPPVKIPEIDAGIGIEEFTRFVRGLISDESPTDDDLLRIFNVFDKVCPCLQDKIEITMINDYNSLKNNICRTEMESFTKKKQQVLTIEL